MGFHIFQRHVPRTTCHFHPLKLKEFGANSTDYIRIRAGDLTPLPSNRAQKSTQVFVHFFALYAYVSVLLGSLRLKNLTAHGFPGFALPVDP